MARVKKPNPTVKPSVGLKRPGNGSAGGIKGSGKGSSWVFVPTAHMGKGGRRVGMGMGPIRSIRAPVGKGGFSKGGKDPHANQTPKQRKSLDKLIKIDADLKVWVGGLSEETTRGGLYAHFKETCKPHLFELMSKRTACMSFRTSEEKQLAIDAFNGSELDGNAIEVDVWTKKERTEKGAEDGEEKPKRKRKRERGPRSSENPSAKPVIKTSFLKKAMSKTGKKAGGNDKMDAKIKEKTKATENSLKVWVGGLPKEITWKELKQHFVDSGCEVDMCDIMRKGTACVTFKTEDDATSAIGIMNDTEVGGKTIQVDEWTMKERKPKDNE